MAGTVVPMLPHSSNGLASYDSSFKDPLDFLFLNEQSMEPSPADLGIF